MTWAIHEKNECIKDAENNRLIMNVEKCGDCELKLRCRFMEASHGEIVYGD